MERSYRYKSTLSTNENSDAFLKHKEPKIFQNSNITSQRTALGDVTSNNARNSNKLLGPGLNKPPQRVHVYTENDENAVPERLDREPLQQLASNRIRQPLADIKHKEYIEFGDESEIMDEEEIEEGEDDGEADEDEIPSSLMPILTPEIHRELYRVYNMFYSETLDEEDEDTFDVSMVSEYSPEIFNYMHSLEIKLRPNPRYMEFQTELKWNMRSILVDWLVQVHSRFNLLPETLFLTVNYIDRFLSKRKVSLSKFQLVGAVALFIAAKYEEINCPSVQEIAYMVDHAYTTDDILKAERFMIDVLEFEMGWPGPMSFLRRTSKADEYDFETRTLAKYFLEITVMDYRFVGSPPSWLAAGAHYLSRLLLNRGEWTYAHIYYSGYTEEQLKPLATALLQSCHKPEEHHKSIYEKYQERRFRRSSLFVQEWFRIAEAEDQ